MKKYTVKFEHPYFENYQESTIIFAHTKWGAKRRFLKTNSKVNPDTILVYRKRK